MVQNKLISCSKLDFSQVLLHLSQEFHMYPEDRLPSGYSHSPFATAAAAFSSLSSSLVTSQVVGDRGG